MKKSGLGDSPFFTTPQTQASVPPDPSPDKPPSQPRKTRTNTPKQPGAKGKASQHDTMPPVDHDTTVSRYHETTIELVRRAVKEFGKEAATHRFTPEEKKAIADVIYAYKGRGIRTSENEITRIAVNFLLNDYQENGENSVLDRILKALNS